MGTSDQEAEMRRLAKSKAAALHPLCLGVKQTWTFADIVSLLVSVMTISGNFVSIRLIQRECVKRSRNEHHRHQQNNASWKGAREVLPMKGFQSSIHGHLLEVDHNLRFSSQLEPPVSFSVSAVLGSDVANPLVAELVDQGSLHLLELLGLQSALGSAKKLIRLLAGRTTLFALIRNSPSAFQEVPSRHEGISIPH
ncbi:hypothetical protein BDV96DRAFT_364305 [Lophiotrema nucula]|uniref:Uncharacterized protein n=1 Tax=Lophiotrema nucula TaxID=690887 RepID=A0A6A5ZI78_9PLEO|nr:hypothetical protein BDV96DRAFT_364305 [Lophiotrema nucula]